MLAGKKILLGVTGSIAAYKSILIVRSLIKEGAEVKVIMTPAAQDFVSRLTLSTLSKNPVLVDLFDEASWANHVMLGRWADVMVIAPLSCNTLSKMAFGQCDNLLLATYLSAVCPVMVAPAMDEDMWHHPATKKALQTIDAHNCSIIPVNNGELASGLFGEGRMAEPEDIIQHITKGFKKVNDLLGKKVVITAGPTYEALDPVRFISNHSSGKMGYALADECANRGASVTLISGPVSIKPKDKNIQLISVTTAAEMYTACLQYSDSYDVAIMAAAVADYTPVQVADEKIKKSDDHFSIALKKTADILKSLGDKKKGHQVLVGFALETTNEKENALKKLKSKNADLIVLNSMRDDGAGFKMDTNKITIFKKDGSHQSFDTKPKNEVAKDIVDVIIEILS